MYFYPSRVCICLVVYICVSVHMRWKVHVRVSLYVRVSVSVCGSACVGVYLRESVSVCRLMRNNFNQHEGPFLIKLISGRVKTPQ